MTLQQPIERGHRIGHGGDSRWGGAGYHHDRHSERARSRKLACSCGAAGILGHDDIDPVFLQQPAFGGFLERAARRHHIGSRRQRGSVGRIDAADQVMVPGRGGESGKILLANGQKHAAWCAAQRVCGGRHVRHDRPTVAGDWLPRRAADGEEGNARSLGGSFGMACHLFGEGMCGIDQRVDAFRAQIGDQAIDASESTDAPRDWRSNRRAGPPGERQGRPKTRIVGECAGECRGFAGAAQDQYAHA